METFLNTIGTHRTTYATRSGNVYGITRDGHDSTRKFRNKSLFSGCVLYFSLMLTCSRSFRDRLFMLKLCFCPQYGRYYSNQIYINCNDKFSKYTITDVKTNIAEHRLQSYDLFHIIRIDVAISFHLIRSSDNL